MKTTEAGQPVNTNPTPKVDDPASLKKDNSAAGDSPKSKFSKVVERLSPEAEQPEGAPLAALGFQPYPYSGPVQAAARPLSAPAQIDSLAQEIASVRANASEVTIQFDSRTMGGLEVRVAKENGKLAVELTSRSAEVTKLLSQNADTLAQRLESRGFVGASVQIRSGASAARSDTRRPPEGDRPKDQQQPRDQRGK